MMDCGKNEGQIFSKRIENMFKKVSNGHLSSCSVVEVNDVKDKSLDHYLRTAEKSLKSTTLIN